MPPKRNEAATAVEEGVDASGSRRASSRPPPWERGSEVEAGSFGTWLRRQRELREISLRDVADRTKISLRYLEAMEDDRFDLLPAPVFAKGFLREYARYIGLSPDEVVNHYIASHGLDGGAAAGEPPATGGKGARSGRRGLFIVAAVVLLVLALAAAYFFLQRRGAPAQSAPPAGAAASRPAPPAVPVVPAEVPATPPERPQSPIEVTLDFTRDCWVEATIDGKPTIAEQRVAGESLPISAQREIVLKLGYAAGVEAQVNGHPFPLPSAGPGQVLSGLTIDLETVRALAAKKPEAG